MIIISFKYVYLLRVPTSKWYGLIIYLNELYILKGVARQYIKIYRSRCVYSSVYFNGRTSRNSTLDLNIHSDWCFHKHAIRMQSILLSRYFTSMQMMMYWTSGWYVLESDDGISNKRNQSLNGFSYPVRTAHSGKWKDKRSYSIII